MSATARSIVRRAGQKPLTVTPTITVATAAYDANDVIGGIVTLSGATPGGGLPVILDEIRVRDAGNQKPVLEILIFNANPAASTLADGGGATVHANDNNKVIARIPVAAGDWVTVGGAGFANLKNLNILCTPASGTSLYMAMIGTGTPDFVAATDLRMTFVFYPAS